MGVRTQILLGEILPSSALLQHRHASIMLTPTSNDMHRTVQAIRNTLREFQAFRVDYLNPAHGATTLPPRQFWRMGETHLIVMT